MTEKATSKPAPIAEVRPGEVTLDVAMPADAQLSFIGRIHTPFETRAQCPRQGQLDGPECVIEVFPPWDQALLRAEEYEHLEVLYWLDRSRRDFITQNPKSNGELFGTFALRSPQRPNPIGTAVVKLLAVEGGRLRVRGLDCLNGTPLLDLKPDRRAFQPKALPKDSSSE